MEVSFTKRFLLDHGVSERFQDKYIEDFEHIRENQSHSFIGYLSRLFVDKRPSNLWLQGSPSSDAELMGALVVREALFHSLEAFMLRPGKVQDALYAWWQGESQLWMELTLAYVVVFNLENLVLSSQKEAAALTKLFLLREDLGRSIVVISSASSNALSDTFGEALGCAVRRFQQIDCPG